MDEKNDMGTIETAGPQKKGIPTLNETVAFMKKAHHGQVDKGGKPYWMHPMNVMRRLGPHASERAMRLALLHDVIEDTDCGEADLLAMGYPQEDVDGVKLLSRPENEPRPAYLEWIAGLAGCGDADVIRVKIADNEENSDPERIAALPPEERSIAKRYARSLAILRPVLAEMDAAAPMPR